MSNSLNTQNSINFQNTSSQHNPTNLTTHIKREGEGRTSTIQEPTLMPQSSISQLHAQQTQNTLTASLPVTSRPLPPKPQKTQAVPLFRSNSIDSDKFLPASCLNQLIKDFYKSSSAPGTTRKRARKTKQEPPNTEIQDEDIPAATTSIRISREARELLPLLANEFIHYITTNATKICEESDKKTINHEHIVASLKRTNFTEYTHECNEVAKDANQQAAKRRKNSNRLENSGKSLAELEAEQAAMFETARLAMVAEYEQSVVDAENAVQAGGNEEASCSAQLPDELADNDDYD